MRGPGGFRFGWDGLIGLIPGVGDLITGSMSMYVIIRAAGLGAPPSLLLRMGGNVLFENIVDMIPFVGNIFDFFWKSNTRNLTLLDNYLARPHATTRKARVWVALTVIVILAAIAGMIAISLLILRAVWDMLERNDGSWTI